MVLLLHLLQNVKEKNIQLCVYSAKQNTRKKMVGSSVIDNDDDIEDSVSKRIKV